jgi:hypothetical protein
MATSVQKAGDEYGRLIDRPAIGGRNGIVEGVN